MEQKQPKPQAQKPKELIDPNRPKKVKHTYKRATYKYFPQPKFVFSVAEVAEREGVHKSSVTGWCRKGHIFPAQLVGKVWVIAKGYIVTGERPAPVLEGTTRSRGRPRGVRNRLTLREKQEGRWKDSGTNPIDNP